MAFEYKCVGGPERPRRLRGTHSRSDRVAVAMQEIIGAEAVDGWEYLRTDLVPVEEKAGIFSRPQEVHRAVLIFRREVGAVHPARMAQDHGAVPGPARDSAQPHGIADQPEPGASDLPDGREGREPRIALSAERGTPPRRGGRPPSGLD